MGWVPTYSTPTYQATKSRATDEIMTSKEHGLARYCNGIGYALSRRALLAFTRTVVRYPNDLTGAVLEDAMTGEVLQANSIPSTQMSVKTSFGFFADCF